jgi:hypothetical protein
MLVVFALSARPWPMLRARLPLMRQDTPFVANTLSLLFASPVLRVQLGGALPQGTLAAVEEDVCASWNDHLDEQERLQVAASGEPSTTATSKNARWQSPRPEVAATSHQLNEEFFYFQNTFYGDTCHCKTPHANSSAWQANRAGQDVIHAMTDAASSYLERIAYHAGETTNLVKLNPNNMHVWASVHADGSAHARHDHAGAVVSGVLYVRSPPGAGKICFYDPRGNLPPFEQCVYHEPAAGDLLIFPPWLSHAVEPTPTGVHGPRISVSFNYVDVDGHLGTSRGWGEATACLEVMPLEQLPAPEAPPHA